MSKKRQKYYVVWVGETPGVYDNWTDCELQIKGFPQAKYKSFNTREEAIEAYRGDPSTHMGIIKSIASHMVAKDTGPKDYTLIPEIRLDGIAVDGACAGNPGKMEYRGVRVIDGAEIFHVGRTTYLTGTNNIAEFLALIHVAALLKQQGNNTTPIYTDSRTALAWLRRGCSKTTLERTPATAKVLDMLERADSWLKNNTIPNPIIKWDTENWGEIPADFNRKH